MMAVIRGSFVLPELPVRNFFDGDPTVVLLERDGGYTGIANFRRLRLNVPSTPSI
jgi:hypothetical protein